MDKRPDDSYIAAQEANKDLGKVKITTGEPLLSSDTGTQILTKYEKSTKDELTGLLNKQVWKEEAGRFFDYCKRNKSSFGVLYLDINNFKDLNDKISHQFGDEVLKLVSSAIVSSIRASDVGGRVGGDEFAVGLPDADDGGLKDVKNRIISKLSELTENSGIQKMREMKPSVTVGFYLSDTRADTFEQAVNEADKNMLKLKKINNYGR